MDKYGDPITFAGFGEMKTEVSLLGAFCHNIVTL